MEYIILVIKCTEEVSAGGRRISCIRFADNMVSLADKIAALESMKQKLEDGMNKYGNTIVMKKMKVMRLNDEKVMRKSNV